MMARMRVGLLCVVLFGACGFQISTGAQVVDGAPGDDDAPTGDGPLVDAPPDEPMADAPHVPWWDENWPHRRLITLDTTRFAGAVTDFPVLVRLPALTGAQASGADLRFVSFDQQTSYAYELDSYNAVGTSLVWVKLSLSNAADTQLWVYYGNATAASTSSGADVFAASNVSVHHLGAFADATGHNHAAVGAGAGTPAINVSGKIGAARTFDGNDDFVTLNNSNGAYDFTTAMYASAWIRVAGFEDPYQAIITKGDSSWRMSRANTGNGVAFGWTSGNTNDNVMGTDSVADMQWHHVAIVKTATAKLVYVDGNKDEEVANAAQLDSNDFSVRFGANEESTSGGARYWHGDMDEIRISDAARDATWIGAEVITVDPAFVTVGNDEAY